MSPKRCPEDVLGLYTGQQLAFLGDSVHGLYARLSVLEEGCGIRVSHLNAVGKVNAKAQAKSLRLIYPKLTDQEREVVKKGRNAHVRKTPPRAASAAEYSAASGFEALLGFLYLTGRTDRLEELLELSSKCEENASG